MGAFYLRVKHLHFLVRTLLLSILHITIGYMEDHFIGGVESNGLCSLLAVATALFVKDYRESLTKNVKAIPFDFLNEVNLNKMIATFESYSQSTELPVKSSILSVFNRQIGLLKKFKNDIAEKKVKYLALGQNPKHFPKCIQRPYIPEKPSVKTYGGGLAQVEVISNWFSDNFVCGESLYEGAFYDLIHLVQWVELEDRKKFEEFNTSYLPPLVDMLLFTDNRILSEGEERIQYKWTYRQMRAMTFHLKSATNLKKNQTSNIFFRKKHFSLCGKDPQEILRRHNLQKITYLDVLYNKLADRLWGYFCKHCPIRNQVQSAPEAQQATEESVSKKAGEEGLAAPEAQKATDESVYKKSGEEGLAAYIKLAGGRATT